MAGGEVKGQECSQGQKLPPPRMHNWGTTRSATFDDVSNDLPTTQGRAEAGDAVASPVPFGLSYR